MSHILLLQFCSAERWINKNNNYNDNNKNNNNNNNNDNNRIGLLNENTHDSLQL